MSSQARCPPWRFPPRCTIPSWHGWIAWPQLRTWRNWAPPSGARLPMSCCRQSLPWTKQRYSTACRQLVEAERVSAGSAATGHPPFKHALIQDAAYQSLLRSTRQQYHQRLAQVLAETVSRDGRDAAGTVRTSLHRGGSGAQAIPYWQRAGQRASNARPIWKRWALLTRGAGGALHPLPDTSERASRSYLAQTPWAQALIVKRLAAPEVRRLRPGARGVPAGG